jgi:SAM-dependent methyltransferase
MLVNFIQDIHNSTKRDYLPRMNADKVHCSEVARKFDKDFFDGDRRYGYGGYKDDGRWKPLAQKLVDRYKLNSKSKVLDIGCGKGFLLRDIQEICGCEIIGYEISDYCLTNSVIDSYKFNAGVDNIFQDYDLIISINTLHNLLLPNLKHALQQISEHAYTGNSYIVVESYRNVQELFNLQCWAFTCEQFLRPEEWRFLFRQWKYLGDWEFIYFE